MGAVGPSPKRSDQSHSHGGQYTTVNGEKVHREQLITRGALILEEKLGPDAPEWLDGFALEWYESLRISGQAVFYTPGDWMTAIFIARFIMTAVRKENASPTMVSAIVDAMRDLCVTEGQRRRVHIELQQGAHHDPDAEAGKAAQAAWVERLAGRKDTASRKRMIPPAAVVGTVLPGGADDSGTGD